MDYSLGDVIISMFWFMLLFIWIWLLIAIVSDIFRDSELSGWGKAGWTFFLIVIPWLGALVYLIARGRSMNERTMQRAAEQEERTRQFVRSAAPAPSTADELAKLADLHAQGRISEADYQQAKAVVLGPTRAAAAPGIAPPRQPV
jgi:hypothetical protein